MAEQGTPRGCQAKSQVLLIRGYSKLKLKKNDINLVPHFGLSLSDYISFFHLVQVD